MIEKTNNCSDNDLLNFIQELETFSSLSSYKKSAYLAYQNEADAALKRLRHRWDELDEEKKIKNYWNKAAQNFDNWLKEAEDLQLTAGEPFQNFKEEIKNHKSKEAIEDEEKIACQYILNKFKAVIKKSLGTEQKVGEYWKIDRSKTFEEIKMAREEIKQKRQKNDDQSSQVSQNSNENYFSKTTMGIAVTIGGSIIILALMIGIKKKLKMKKKFK